MCPIDTAKDKWLPTEFVEEIPGLVLLFLPCLGPFNKLLLVCIQKFSNLPYRSANCGFRHPLEIADHGIVRPSCVVAKCQAKLQYQDRFMKEDTRIRALTILFHISIPMHVFFGRKM